MTAALACCVASGFVAVGSEAVGDDVELLVNRATGGVLLANNSTESLPIAGYSLTSDAGSFAPAAWTPVAGAYDADGDGSIDSDDHWSVLSQGGPHDLSEAELGGGDGGVFGPGGVTIDLGTPWLRSPYEDVRAELLLNSGEVLPIAVTYLGDPVAPGDLDGDGAVDAADWRAFRNAYRSDLGAFNQVEAHAHGDMNGDGKTDARDFVLFKGSYEAEHGAGSLAALTSVPEPSTLGVAACAALALVFRRRVRWNLRRHGTRVVTPGLCIVALLAPTIVQAQTVESFHYSTGGLAGRNGGSGWGGAWRNNFSRSGADWTLAGPGLDYPTLASEVGIAATSVGDGSRFQRNLPQTYNSGVAYLSYLSSNTTGNGDPYSALELQMGGDADPFRVFQIGLLRNDDGNPNGGSENAFYARSRGSVGGGGGDEARLGDFNTDTNLFVVRFDLNADTANIFFNPNDRDDLTGPGDATLDLFTGFAFDRIGIANFAGTNAFSIDEVRLAAAPPTLAPAPELELVVDRARGVVRLQNRSTVDIDIDFYEITSDGSSLSKANWRSLQEQDFEQQGDPQTPPTGDGWEEFDGGDASFVGEAFLQGNSTIAAGTRVTLGKLYDAEVDAHDLHFTYHDADKGLVEVPVVDESLDAPLGDFNGDDVVNSADYTVYRDNLGGSPTAFAPGSRAPGHTGSIGQQDYLTWAQNYCASASTAAASSVTVVPEPSAAAIAFGASVGVLALRADQRRVHSTEH